MIAVQTISTTWTKKSRGGQLATLRSRVPTSLRLRTHIDVSELVWHSIRFDESNEFAEPTANDVTGHIQNESFGCRNIQVNWDTHSAALTYRYQAGMPVRKFFDKHGTPVAPEHTIHIEEKSWASVQYNGRYASVDTGNWWYENVVVNVAVMQSFDDGVFLQSEPIERYTQLASLW